MHYTTDMAPKESTPLPLSNTLGDLAILRASDVDLSAVLSGGQEAHSERSDVVAQSYEFVSEARAALRILYRGDVDKEGERVDGVRNGLEEVLRGLATASPKRMTVPPENVFGACDVRRGF